MNTPPTDWSDLLNRLVQALNARGGAISLLGRSQEQVVAAVGLAPAVALAGHNALLKRSEFLAGVLTSGRPDALDLEADQANPAVGALTLIFAPLFGDGRLLGYVEIVQRSLLSSSLRIEQLKFLEQNCRLKQAAPAPTPPSVTAAADAAPSAASSNEVDWPAALNCLRQIQSDRRLPQVAGAIANECRLLFHADRVSVGVPRGRRFRIIAVSGQDAVQHRSNVLQAMAEFTRLIAATKEPFRFEGGLDDIPPPLEAHLARFTELSGARLVVVVPLLTPQKSDHDSSSGTSPVRKARPREVEGALIIEQMRDSRPDPGLVAHLDLLREHLAAELHHARAYDSIWLLPVWAAIGRWWSALRGRRLAFTLLIAGLLIGAAAALIKVPWPYRVEGRGQLMPVVQRDVFAPWEGQVIDLMVDGGERVAEGQPLVQLRNDELSAERAKTRGELAQKRELVVALLAQVDDADKQAKPDEVTRLHGKVGEAKLEVKGLEERLAILNARFERLTVRAPIAGVVTTFQVEQLLVNRPVQRGDVLLQVMDDRGLWHLELDIPERRLGHVLAAQQQISPDLPITFRLLTDPEASHQARLASVGTRSVTSEERGSVVELRGRLDIADIDRPSIGAAVRARIDCGPKPLGYCLFGDVIEFVQSYFWW